jgi:transposase
MIFLLMNDYEWKFKSILFYLTKNNYAQVAWSDESMIRLQISNEGKIYRRAGDKYSSDCVVKNLKHPTQIMIWGMISSRGVGPLVFVDGHMNSEKYINILKNEGIPQLRDWFGRAVQGRAPYYFMQDGAPCHTSKVSTGFLQMNKINIFPWPGNSPDMNPIESVWNVLKKEVRKKIEKLRTVKRNLTELELLKLAINHCWYNSKKVKITAMNSCTSMARRIQMLRKQKGRWTKY